MTKQTGNHDIRFEYPQTASTDNSWFLVYANDQHVGYIEKVYNGWNLFDTDGRFKPICKGLRQYAAEHLAFWAGLLDADYNESTLETANA